MRMLRTEPYRGSKMVRVTLALALAWKRYDYAVILIRKWYDKDRR